MEEIDVIIAASETAEEEAVEIPDEEESGSSWTVEGGAAIKQADRHVFLFREAVLPPKVCTFFGVADLNPGMKEKLVFRYGDRQFAAHIEKTLHADPRTRLMWKADFGTVLQKQYPEWVEYFRKSRAESGDAPYLQFTRTGPMQYMVELEGAIPDTNSRDFEVPLAAGDTIDNETLRAIFRCSLQGPVRRALPINGLVIVSDHTGPVDDDKWIGKVFHFTGSGTIGEKGPGSLPDRALAGAKESGVRLFLFEVFTDEEYTFMGEALLMDNPYRSRQPDGENVMRDVFVFPLELKGHKNPPLGRKTRGETLADLAARNLLPASPAVPEHRAVAPARVRTALQARAAPHSGGSGTGLFDPDQIVSEYALKEAHGMCRLCGLPAPFATRAGEPYLELHHIIPLAEGGTDTPGNVVALCPNCHRKMHVLALQADVAKLRKTGLMDK